MASCNSDGKLPALRRQARRFGRDRNGAILPLFAILAIFIIVAGGAGLDFARAINQRQAIARGLDAAMLAVARELSVRNMTESEIKAYLDANYQAYFGANIKGSSGGGEIIIDEPKINTETRVIEVSARSSVPTYFIHLAGFGPDALNVSVSAEAVYPKSVEATLVLDVTGSMAGSRIVALRNAAANFINTLVPPDTVATNEKVRIAVVPYASGVNIGSTRANLATKGANASRTSYPGCVSERTGAQAYTDASYTIAAIGPGAQQASSGRGYYYDGRSMNNHAGFVCPKAELVPLTLDPGSSSKPGTPLHTIANLAASGNTAGQTGVAWGWYTLSEKWAGLWPSASKPAPYSDERVLKYMLLMTDGDFNTWFDGPMTVSRTTYDWVARLDQATTSTTRAIALCDAVKKSGIRIITVGFQIGSNAQAKKVMNDCASSPSDYYLAENDAELNSRFQAIANQIKSTYLSR
ncbi:TadE/TadG family type IV pilus assembly protein [Stappia sp. P2PMeth1]|uniref:TadE/TadG family type IV pilus assembly protein n=1 Tax=Stappia sp. P2PMeth1 TaxID=2003586 RepID=UPI001646871B|nr:TadE/TadG family type IV pilus assembly protein [Stappia sp. P2PMeth1]